MRASRIDKNHISPIQKRGQSYHYRQDWRHVFQQAVREKHPRINILRRKRARFEILRHIATSLEHTLKTLVMHHTVLKMFVYLQTTTKGFRRRKLF